MPSTLISLGVLQDRGFKAKLDDNMSFELSNGDIKLKFDKNESNVWAGDFINEYECIACDTEGNERSTTSQEEIKFKLMDALHRDLHHPSDQVLSRMLRNGKILNTPCVSSDVTRYREFIGTCTGCAKGKMTAKSAKPSLTARSTKCGELVHVDLMFFGGFIFLVAVDDFSRKKFTIEIPSKQKADIISYWSFSGTWFWYVRDKT